MMEIHFLHGNTLLGLVKIHRAIVIDDVLTQKRCNSISSSSLPSSSSLIINDSCSPFSCGVKYFQMSYGLSIELYFPILLSTYDVNVCTAMKWKWNQICNDLNWTARKVSHLIKTTNDVVVFSLSLKSCSTWNYRKQVNRSVLRRRQAFGVTTTQLSTFDSHSKPQTHTHIRIAHAYTEAVTVLACMLVSRTDWTRQRKKKKSK